MKRFISIILLLSMISFLFACGDTTTSEEPGHDGTFKVGYGNTVITPLPEHGPLMLGGHSASYEAAQQDTYKRVIDDLPCTCIAITDVSGNTVLIFSLETLKTYSTIVGLIPQIAKAVNLPESNILVSATHNHHAPNTHANYVNANYLSYVKEQMISAGKIALGDRKTARLYTAASNIEGYNSCRHYIMSDGRKVTTTELSEALKTSYIVGHVVDADNQMQLIKFVREGGSDVVLMNWQSHPYTSTSYMNIVSCTEYMRKVFEQKGILFAHFNGACGNVGYASRVSGATVFPSQFYKEAYEALAEQALSLDSKYQEAQIGNLSVLEKQVVGKHDKGNMSVKVYGLAFGDIAFIFAPYEMFTENGIAIKEASPYKITFVATNAMGDNGYIPSAPTFEYGGYEVKSCRLGKGAAEILEEGFIELLKALKGA